MSWITLTEAKVITKLSGPEISATKTAALQSGQANPLPEIIAQVTREVRSYVATCERNQLGDGQTIPDELEGAAISRIRFELATRLPVASLLNEDRRSANTQAFAMLRDAAACKITIEQPTTPTTEVTSGPAARLVTSTTRVASRSKLAGL